MKGKDTSINAHLTPNARKRSKFKVKVFYSQAVSTAVHSEDFINEKKIETLLIP